MENKHIDLTKILKIGDKVYSPIFKEGIVVEIESSYEFPIVVKSISGLRTTFSKDGRYIYESEVLLFPSEDHRNWDGNYEMILHPPKKGDYVISERGNCFIYNGIIKEGCTSPKKYGAIVGVIDKTDISFNDGSDTEFTTNILRYATPEEIKEFDEFLKSKEYYFDKEELVLKKYTSIGTTLKWLSNVRSFNIEIK